MISDSCYDPRDLTNCAVKLFQRYKILYPFLLFGATRAAVQDTARALSRIVGGEVIWVHAGLTSDVRMAMLEAIRDGEVLGAAVTDVWSTGVDIPCLRTIIIGCGGSAPIGLIQRFGRGTRALFGIKGEYTVYDLPIGGRQWRRHRQKRLQSYRSCGLHVHVRGAS